MRHSIVPTARRLIPAAGLLLATTLGGCVGYNGYNGYPPDRYGYDNRYNGNYQAGYTSYPPGYAPGYTYTTTNNDPAYYPNDISHYPPVHFGSFNPHADGGGGG